MANQASKIDSTTFAKVAAELVRWSEKSLRISSAVLVEGKTPAEVAQAESVTPQHVSVVCRRFMERVKARRVVEFMSQESPKRSTAVLEPFLQEMRTLRDKGYTITQVVAFLKKNGVQSSPTTVSEFLRSNGA